MRTRINLIVNDSVGNTVLKLEVSVNSHHYRRLIDVLPFSFNVNTITGETKNDYNQTVDINMTLKEEQNLSDVFGIFKEVLSL